MSIKSTILIVEDDSLMSDSLKKTLLLEGYEVFAAATGNDAKRNVENTAIDLILLDIKLPDIDGLELLSSIREIEPDIPILMMTAYSDVSVAVSAMKAGANDYLQKPFELDELKLLISKALENSKLKSELTTLKRAKLKEPWEIIGETPPINELKELISIVAKTPRTPVLLIGESGTGKELVANAIHRSSDRKNSPMIKINVSAIPENLLESEFFGYKKGAFTDAKESKKGLFELANRGTLFLDEIGEMKPSLQPKLLRFLETRTFNPVGAIKEIKVDVRVIAATNQDLAQLVSEGRFRDDLYYRLKVMEIEVPPLRDRKEDIPHLIDAFLEMANRELNKEIKTISDDAKRALMNYDWPGNVRELKNVIERMVILTGSNEPGMESLPMELVKGTPKDKEEGIRTLMEVEEDHISKVLRAFKGNKSRAAKALGISRSTLFEKLNRYSQKQTVR